MLARRSLVVRPSVPRSKSGPFEPRATAPVRRPTRGRRRRRRRDRALLAPVTTSTAPAPRHAASTPALRRGQEAAAAAAAGVGFTSTTRLTLSATSISFSHRQKSVLGGSSTSNLRGGQSGVMGLRTRSITQKKFVARIVDIKQLLSLLFSSHMPIYTLQKFRLGASGWLTSDWLTDFLLRTAPGQ